MSRPPALNPTQQEEVRRRLAAGEGVRALAREYKVGSATIRRLATHSAQVRNVAEKLAAAQDALATLPAAHQYAAISLSEKLRNISVSLASAAELGAKTAHRLQSLANSEVARVEDSDPMASMGNLRNVGVLTKLANDSASIALNLLAANRDRIGSEPPAESELDTGKLSDSALRELLDARTTPAV